MKKNKITIPITDKLHLVYRVTNISKVVLLVRQVPSLNTFGSVALDRDETEQSTVATSAAGCSAVAEALQDMAEKIRALPKESQ